MNVVQSNNNLIIKDMEFFKKYSMDLVTQIALKVPETLVEISENGLATLIDLNFKPRSLLVCASNTGVFFSIFSFHFWPSKQAD